MMPFSDLQNSVCIVLKKPVHLLTPEFGVRLLVPVDTIYLGVQKKLLYFSHFSFKRSTLDSVRYLNKYHLKMQGRIWGKLVIKSRVMPKIVSLTTLLVS